MSSTQVGAVLRHIRRLATSRKDQELPDRQLLERFALHQDGDAFAALLKRHGPMVLGVCQSILHNLHDAEDAFQAAFLVLARKAGSIHRREAVSSWLHRVAYHLAVRAQADAARRRVFERRAVTMPTADPVLDLSLRELRGVLNEELQQLPEEYRAPVVLCCLEEKSVEEAARLLGWTKWTVKGRLQRGRERLRARLRRRGLDLSAGLFAAALATGSVSAQVPATLAGSTVKAALWLAAGKEPVAGLISAKVTALVKGATTTMIYSKAKIATVLLLAMGVAATAFGVARHQVSAADQPAAEQNQAAKPKEKGERPPPDARLKPAAEATIEVQGRVLDSDGKPVAGAKLYLAQSTGLAWKGPAPSQRATSGPDGRFRFSFSKSEREKLVAEKMQWPSQVMAVGEGHGCDWAKIGSAGEELTLRLVKDVPIRGRILDPDGKPVAGAKVTMIRMWAPKGDDLDESVEAIRKGERYPASAKDWTGGLPGRPAVLTTGADGRFQLAGVGRERIVQFSVEGSGIASGYLGAVMTRATDKIVNVTRTGAGPHTHIVYGATFDYLGASTRPIRGVLRDKATGKPVAGASVHGGRAYDSDDKAFTNKDGRYDLLGLAKSTGYFLTVKSMDGLHFRRLVEFQDTPGLDPLTADIELMAGAVTVRGKVTDRATGKPIARARVEYYPLFDNPHVGKLSDEAPVVAETLTGPDGSYTLTVLPGPGVIGVIAPEPDAYMPGLVTLQDRKDFFKTPLANQHEDTLTSTTRRGPFVIRQTDYNAFALLEPGEKETALVKDVALKPPQTVKGRVVGPDGQPLTGVTVYGLVRFGEETLKGADFTVRGLNPRANRPLLFYHKDKNLGFFLQEWRSATSGPLTVKLQPCVSASGRVLDRDGDPVAGLRLDVWGMGPGPASAHYWDEKVLTTDKDGRFRIEGLVPGQMYRIDPILAHVQVEAGKHKDMGDLKR